MPRSKGGGGGIIVVGDNCRMADKIKYRQFFLLKQWGIVVVGDKKKNISFSPSEYPHPQGKSKPKTRCGKWGITVVGDKIKQNGGEKTGDNCFIPHPPL